ncbi:MAG TPA: hypothetical protein DCR43_05925 [Bacteroidales bacterium]|nr:MAG: hypothetical protein A2X11_04955 [Bacteroidetes bacterium GWE2_42_24]OFY30690.1 MAG: hypothetical protein A2X09_14460 [Bacteroidetes bacterium GWF2_43_11]HAQ65372.1 hypothetical protein [Bacteroidales bacterium]HBZ65685.1 hypothetical protein [Bacteroidales bacterium]
MFLGIVAAAFLTTSCEKVKDLTSFSVSLPSPEHQFTLDSADYALKSIASETLFTYQHITVNIDSILNAHGVSSATITNGNITNVVVTILLPEDKNFDWLGSARLVAGTDLQTLSAGTQIARTGTIAPGSISVSLILDNAAITNLINNNNFYLGLYGTLLGPLPASQLTLSLNSTLVFTISPLGN